MAETAELFELNNVRRFRKFWETCNQTEKNEIIKIIKLESGEEIEEKLSTKKLNIQADEVIDFLNLKAGSKYRKVETHRRKIRARLKSGITVQDLKSIIAKKTREWTGSEYEDKLRPKTLFTETNCENYLGGLG